MISSSDAEILMKDLVYLSWELTLNSLMESSFLFSGSYL
ncbi:hypothetical protein PROCH_0802 [Prochlorococcus marinus str. EQPAC1]|nr:hypothetical protein PROCH_0802 [Prochlorococcus marinus str. EQPAC1]